MKKLGFFLFSSVFALSAFAQKEDSAFIKSLSDYILTKGQAYENLRVLTKQIGQRLSGSAGMYKAEAWGLKTMKEAGADNAYLQQCMVPHWVRGGKDEATARPAKGQQKNLDVLALGNSLGSAKPVTAQVIEVKNFDDLEAKKDQVKDKIVFYNYPFNQTFVKTFEAYGDAVQYRGAGASRVAKYGAQGAIVRSMSESTDNNPHTGFLRYDSAYKKNTGGCRWLARCRLVK